MKKSDKTREQLLKELEKSNKRIVELEKFKTERKQAEEEINNSEKKFKILTESAPIGIYYSDLNGTFLYGNKKAEEIIGYKLNELIGKNFLKLKLLDTKHILKAAKLLALNKLGKSTGPDYFKLNTKDGGQKQVDISTRIINIEGQKVVLGMVQDITKRKQAEEALQESEKKFRNYIESSSDIMYVVNDDLKFLYGNRKYLERRGLTQKELLGKEYEDFHSDEGTGNFKERVKAVRESGKPIFYEYQSEIDGKYFLRTISPVIDTDTEEVESITVISRDITGRKQAEEAIQESEERYRGLSEAAFEAIFISEKGVCLEQNSPAENMFGYTLSEAIGRIGTEWIVPEDREMVMNNMLSGYEEPYETIALRKDGSTFPTEIQGKMMHYKGRIVRVTALNDITKRRKAENELKEKMAILERFNRLTVDRELRMIELKKEINDLLEKAGLEKKYSSPD